MMPVRSYRGAAPAEYASLRGLLAPQFRKLPAEDIEALFESYNLSANDMEGFFDTLKDIGKAVVSAAPSILPVAGTVVGTALGGPAGAALGGTLGKFAGGAFGNAAPPRPPGPQPPPGGAPAAGQLLQTMFQPETLKALMQMLLGQLGASNVKVGSTPVPVGGFPNLLGTLANNAQSEYNAANRATGEGLPEYLRNTAGEAVGDPAEAEYRAQRLYELIQEADAEQASPRRMARSRGEAYAEANSDDEVLYVELEPAELFTENEFS